MTRAGFAKLKTQLRRDEGSRLESYRDGAGNLTIGVGHNIDAHGIWITKQQEEQLLDEDLTRVVLELHAALPWVPDLDEPRRRVLYNMGFNIGTRGLLGFKRTLHAVEHRQFPQAATFMLQSRWAEQVGARAHRLAETMRTGVD